MSLTRIFHVSDVHFGVEDRAALAWFAQAVAAEAPAAVLCTGDLTQRATRPQFAAARDWFAQLGVPVMLQPGNHDMPYYNLWERFRQPFARFQSIADVGQSSLTLDCAVIVPLNTNVRAQRRWPWSDGVVTRGNLDAALSRLEAVADDPRTKLVACHHPLLPARDGEENPTIDGDGAFAELAAAGARAVLSGHVHVPFDLQRSRDGRAMRMIGAGTLSTRLRGAAPSYNVVTISRDGEIGLERRDFPIAA